MKSHIDLSEKSGECYVIAKRWASDLDFLYVESVFFHYLLEKYAADTPSPATIEYLKTLGKELRMLEEKRLKIEILIHEQLELIVSVAENIIPENFEKITSTHATLEPLIAELTKRFKGLKRKIFEVLMA